MAVSAELTALQKQNEISAASGEPWLSGNPGKSFVVVKKKTHTTRKHEEGKKTKQILVADRLLHHTGLLFLSSAIPLCSLSLSLSFSLSLSLPFTHSFCLCSSLVQGRFIYGGILEKHFGI